MGRGKIGRGPPTVLVSIASTSWNVGFFIARTGSIIGVILSSGGKERLRDYDKMLKAFKYSAALDLVLKKVRLPVHPSDDRKAPTRRPFQSIPPTISFSLITELIHQDALRSALSGRDDVLLEPILHLLVRYISDPRFGELACDVATIVLGASFSSY